MREIKFRAWLEGTHEGIAFGTSSMSYEVSIGEKGGWLDIESGWDIHGEYTSVPLMQFTGLKDKNGKDIYEGDILLCDWDDIRYRSHNIGPVEWDTENASWNLGEGGSPFEDAKTCFSVIGNIYENPELLVNK